MSRTKGRIIGLLAAIGVAAIGVPHAEAGTAPTAFFNPTGGYRNVALTEAGASVTAQSSGSPATLFNLSSSDGAWTTSGVTNQFVKFLLVGGTSGMWVIDRIHIRSVVSCCPTNRVKNFAIDVSTTDSADASFTNVLIATAADITGLQQFTFTPVQARYVRYRPLSNAGSTSSITTNQIKVMSGQHSPSSTFTFQNLSTDADADIASYGWDFGDGTTSTDAAPVHTFAGAGSYTVTLTVTDLEAGVGTFSTVLRVLSLPTVSYTSSPPNPTEATNISFCDTSTDPDGSIILRTWSWGDGTSNTVSTAVCVNHAFGDNLTYTVSLTVVDQQEQSASASTYVTPTNLPPAVNVGSDRRWVSGERLTSGVSITDPGFRDTRTCVWDHGDGTTRNVCGSFDHTYSVPASPAETFTASLTAIDDDGAQGTDSLDIEVYPQMFAQISSAPVDAVGVDWSRLLNRLVVTRGGTCVNSLALVSLDGTSTPSITGDMNPTTCAETKLAVSPGSGGFGLGDVFLGNGNVGQISRVRLDAAGTVVDITSQWATLAGTTTGRPNGGLAFDDVGGFGGDLLAALSDGKVYRVTADGTSTLLANFARLLEGADVAGPGFGPASGCLITTDGASKRLLAACPDGSTMTLATVPSAAALTAPAFVSSAGDVFYGDPVDDRVYRGDSRYFTSSLAGHVLVSTAGGEIWDVSYDEATATYASVLHSPLIHGATADPTEQLVFVSALAAPGTTLDPAAATVLVGDVHTIAASVVDASGMAVEGMDLAFDVTAGPNTGVTGTATTDATGEAVFAYRGTAGPGVDTIVARSGGAVTAPVGVTWVLRPALITADALVGVLVPGGVEAPLGPRATLTDETTGAPVVGRVVEFSAGDPQVLVCTGTTDGSGVATCGGPAEVAAILLAESYRAAFVGDTTYASATDDASLVRISVEG